MRQAKGNMKNCRKPGLRLDLRQENILILRNEDSSTNQRCALFCMALRAHAPGPLLSKEAG